MPEALIGLRAEANAGAILPYFSWTSGQCGVPTLECTCLADRPVADRRCLNPETESYDGKVVPRGTVEEACPGADHGAQAIGRATAAPGKRLVPNGS